MHPSRPRLILQKLKRQASALVLRTSTPQPVSSPSIHITESDSFDDDNDDDDDDDDLSLPHEHDEFTPYLPLVAQYERAALFASSTSLKIPTVKNTIFSRPASALTASTTATPLRISPPPSPSSSHSSSSASTATDPLTPKTPTFNALGYTSSSCSFSTSRSTWSLCTDDSIPIPTPPPYPLFSDHPFARSNITSDPDPFAKASVSVVRLSSSDYSATKQERSFYPAPKRPPPVGPLPHLPSSTDEEDNQVIRIRETEEWTLKLGLPPSLVPTPAQHLNLHLKPPSPHHLQPPSTTTTTNSFLSPSHPRTRIRTRSLSPLPPTKGVHTYPIKPKPKILRIQIEPENALDVDKDDWTLSLPLSLPHPLPEPNSAPPENGRTRPRHRSQPGLGKEKEKQKGKEVRERVSVHSLPYQSSRSGAPTRPSASFANLLTSAASLHSKRRHAQPQPKLPDPPRTADSTSTSSSVSTIVPRHVQVQTEEQERAERDFVMQRALSSTSVRTSSRSSSSSFDSGVGILDIVGVDRDEGLRWMDGERWPSTPNVNLDPGLLRNEGEKEVDGLSMVSGHSIYYSARSSLDFLK